MPKTFEKPKAGSKTGGQAGKPRPLPDGLAARQTAVAALSGVLNNGRSFDDVFARAAEKYGLPPRDRAFARAIAGAALRRKGSLDAVINRFLEKPIPEKNAEAHAILLAASAQLLILATPPHAAISLSVDQCRLSNATRRFDKLANAVLRRVAEQGPHIFKSLDSAALDIPQWMLEGWRKAYGPDAARDMALASLREAPLDVTVKSDAEDWAKTLSGIALPTGSVRIAQAGRVDELPGYAAGAWWVQDAAAALPAKLLGDVAGKSIADVCAAPGGKTAQLAASGAKVLALDQSGPRLDRLKDNLKRLGLSAETVVADAATWQPGQQFDAVLADVPCTATGTIRRHPDILRLKRADDVNALAALQARILDQAAQWVKPGGTLVYCSCSLEPKEGVEQVERLLARNTAFERAPIAAGECGIAASWLSPSGDLRTLPSHYAELPEGLGGLDGFYAARLRRKPQ